MSTQARFHSDNTARQLVERALQSQTLDLAPQNDLSLRIKTHKVKNVLAYIKAYAGKNVSCLGLSACHGMVLLSSAGGKSLQTNPPDSQMQPVHPISGHRRLGR
jgi:hypothetical protein